MKDEERLSARHPNIPSPLSTPYLIGLTGNIATGKSEVGRILSGLGAEVIDADRLVHDLERKGEPVYRAIVAAFGEGILGPDGEIDRRKLGNLVFQEPAALERLEAIVHPAVREAFLARLSQSLAPVVVYDAIKLIESGAHHFCDALWVVTAPREVQVARLMQRRGFSRPEAELRVDAQPSQAEKAALADVVLDNSGTLDDLRRQVLAAWQRCLGDLAT